MTPTQQKAMEMALEVLEKARPLKADYLTLEDYGFAKGNHYAAMAALRAALAEQADDKADAELSAWTPTSEKINALEPVAWMYDRVGSTFNPHFLIAGPVADQRRNGIVSEGVVILNPDSACKNWQPLTALGSKT